MLTTLNNNKDPTDGFMSVDNSVILVLFWLSDSSMLACEKNSIYVCIYMFFIFFSIMVYYKILSRVPYAIQ